MAKQRTLLVLLSLFFIIATLSPAVLQADNHDINRMSVKAANGFSSNGDSTNASVSGDGKFVAFSSDATDLVLSDSNAHTDIFLVNRNTPTPIPVRISIDTSGGNTDGDSDQPNISYDGNVTVFRSTARDLVAGPSTQFTPQVFLYNRISTPTPLPTPIATAGAFALISVNAAGTPGNGSSYSPKTSNAGAYVVFASDASNLTASCTSSTNSQIYLFDASNSSTPLTCISVNSGLTGGNDDSYSPSMTKDGALIAFESKASDLTTTNTQNRRNIYLYTRSGSTITLVSSDTLGNVSNGESSNPVINADGTYIIFQTNSTDIVANCPTASTRTAVILYKIADGTKTCASVAPDGGNCNGNSIKPAISGDGNVVAYLSDCINLVSPEAKKTPASGVYDLYRMVRGTPTINITRENTTVAEVQITPGADNPVMNGDGSIVAFESAAKLRTNDNNGLLDIYVTDANCTTDSDGDATVDCNDTCYLDANKLTAGTCGCGVADTDTDSDGTPDCNDGCPSDATKTTPGICGCGVAVTDTDGNGVVDCAEPNANTYPSSLLITRQRANHRIIVDVGGYYANKNYTFTIQLLVGKKVIRTISTQNKRVIF